MAVRADDVDLLRDRALVERFQAGDDEGFEDLYRRYYPRLLRFCAKRLGDQHEAEEVAQEAFVKALRALPRLQGERRFYPWLTVIASRLCVDAHRRQGRTEPTPDVDLGVIDGGQEAVIEATDLVLLDQAMARLSPRHRQVLHLREREGWTYQQIASHLDCTQGTVEALLFRARRSLRKEFHAVAGDGRLAALPVLGWLHRKLGQLAERAALWPGTQLAPLGANALSAAVVAGTVAVGAMGIGQAATPAPTRVATAPSSITVSPPTASMAESVAPTDAEGTARPPAAASAPPAAGPRPAPRQDVVVAEDVGEREARRRAADQPVNADTPPAAVGVEPTTPVRFAEDALHVLGVTE